MEPDIIGPMYPLEKKEEPRLYYSARLTKTVTNFLACRRKEMQLEMNEYRFIKQKNQRKEDKQAGRQTGKQAGRSRHIVKEKPIIEEIVLE